jgi:hypothetical protein
MCDESDDYAVELTREWRRARKEHRCYACRETIRKADRYHVTAHIFEGRLETFKHCARCYTILEALWSAGAEAVDLGLDCGETWEDNFDECPPEVARLAFMTRDEAQAMLAEGSR